MNKILDLYAEALSNKISKIELKKRIKEGIANLDAAAKYLRSVDPEKFMDALARHLPIVAEKAYDEGKISEENVEAARRLAIISPNGAAQAIYEMNKKMLDYCKSLKEKKKKS
jgi:uncharacterized radical SAM superfamily protein